MSVPMTDRKTRSKLKKKGFEVDQGVSPKANHWIAVDDLRFWFHLRSINATLTILNRHINSMLKPNQTLTGFLF